MLRKCFRVILYLGMFCVPLLLFLLHCTVGDTNSNTNSNIMFYTLILNSAF